jgi:pimeloyl-ACP methyl ester carboxylesterase
MTEGKPVADWNGFRMEEFELENILPGRPCKTVIVCPEEAAPAKPWVWRAEFFGSFPWADLALVRRGWHIAYCSLSDMYGAPGAIEGMKRFHRWCAETRGFSPKPAIFGFSRGGLYAVNYAYSFPGDNCCLYLDAPVLDIRYWPGGFGRYPVREKEWRQCMEVYGLTDETAGNFDESPLNHAPYLAKKGIPVLLVAGDADEAVYYPENGGAFAEKYRAAGGVIEVILKPGCKHHPHSLEDPAPIVDFILKCRDKYGT